MPDLLIELFSEEIPARMQARAADDLRRLMTDGLVEAGLTYGSAGAFATPRRLALSVTDLLADSPATREERKGPRADAPDKAIAGFLRSTGLDRDQLEERATPKGAVLYAVMEKSGRPAEEIVAEVLTEVVESFPWPKSMRWGAGNLRWVRPLQSILCVLTDEAGTRVVPGTAGGIAFGNSTEGHRFMAPGRFSVTGFDDYSARLKRARVILDPAERAAAIWNDATNAAFAQGLEVVEDRALLDEIAGLIEWPVVLLGQIGAEFLDLPPEVLRTSMKEHQKFLSVRDSAGQIVRFVTVANRETADDGATILAGNQKVLSARLSDAMFFWQNDLREATRGMGAWEDSLKAVTFQSKLGSQYDRIRRIADLARRIAPLTGADPDAAEQAARLAKLDLSSQMVYEFPELQGLMGRYYVARAGHSPEIAAAAQDHYAPLGPSDTVPSAPVSVTVALADKLDTLAGFWAIDEKPTGSKDPFALRRAALGVIRLVCENDISVPLRDVIIGTAHDADADNLLGFFHDRLKVYLRDRGVRHDVIDACVEMEGADDLARLVKRAEALDTVLRTEDGENLVQGFRRASNILAQAEAEDGVEYSFGADIRFAETDEERALFAALEIARERSATGLERQDFPAAMRALADLRGPVDAFFDAVMINADSPAIRRNRLNLLSSIRSTCLQVADLGKIAG